MSALNWIKTAGGLFTPYHTLAPWKFLPCVDPCCGLIVPPVIPPQECQGAVCPDGIPAFLAVTIGGMSGTINCFGDLGICPCDTLNGTTIVPFVLALPTVCVWEASGETACSFSPPNAPTLIQVRLTGGKLFATLSPSCGAHGYVSDSLPHGDDCLDWEDIELDSEPFPPAACTYPPTILISASPDPDDL